MTIEPPIPVEDIVEKYLKLRIEFDDMHARHNIPRPPNGQPDILGAIYGDGSIFIDESLDPEENPSREGRFRFTLAHEGGGHWPRRAVRAYLPAIAAAIRSFNARRRFLNPASA